VGTQTTTATLASERGADQVDLIATGGVYTAADQVDNIALPPAFGDCLILEAFMTVNGEATSLTAFADTGVRVALTDPAGNLLEFVGVPRILKTGAARHAAQCTPDSLVVWKSTEVLQWLHQQLDTNAAPTAAPVYLIRVRRLRDEPANSMTDRLGRQLIGSTL
jgi:hypothetical protein